LFFFVVVCVQCGGGERGGVGGCGLVCLGFFGFLISLWGVVVWWVVVCGVCSWVGGGGVGGCV